MIEPEAFSRRWRFLAALLLAALPGTAAALDHSGTCTGTFAAVQNPHRLTGTCTVPSGQTLTIEAGVILVGQNNSIQVQDGGTLNVTGTSAAQRDAQLTNAVVQFNAGSAGQLKNCTITNSNLSYGVYIADASPTVMACTISSGNYGIYVTGSSQVTPAEPALSGNSITAGRVGLQYVGGAAGTASGNTIGFPHGATSGRAGIDLSANADPVLDGNTILDDTTEADVGIELETNAGVAVDVTNNVIHASGTDRLIDFTPNVFGGTGPTITGNQFPDGLAGGFGLSGSLTGTATLAAVQGQSTFTLTSTLTVQDGATLNVAPGITVVGRNNSIQVQNGGTLNAVGTSTAQRDVQLMDAYVQFNAGSGGQLKNCTIADPTLSYGIYISDASPTVMGCTISSGNYGIYVTGSSPVTPAQPLLSGNSITAARVGLQYTGGASGTASGNTIGFPHGVTSGRVGIDVSANAEPVLDGNTILDDTTEADVGIELEPNAGVAVQVKNNVIHGSGTDRLIDFTPNVFGGAGPTITGNQFPDGPAGGFGLSGSLTGTATLAAVQGQATFKLTSTLAVESGATLNVAPGITVAGHNNSIQVQNGGTLNAVGTSTAQRDVQLMDAYVQFNAGSGGQLKNCTIANPTLSYGVYIADASPTVMDCTISSGNYGIYVTGSSPVTPAQPLLSGNSITAARVGLQYTGGASGTASGNTIGFPHGVTSGRVGIDVSANAEPVLDGNTILDDTTEADVGIELEPNAGVALQVKNNVIHGSGTDRLIDFTPNVFGGSGPTMTGNQFPDGLAGGFGLSGSLNGTATLAAVQGQGTFKLISTLSVENGATLNVAAGITVAGRNNSIQVQNGGTLNAVGTSTAQRDVQLMDTYVQFNAGSGGQMKNCIIANPTLSYGIYISDASPTVMDCTISSANYGIYVTGSSPVTPAQPLLSGNSITASGVGLQYSGAAGGMAIGNTISFPHGATSGRVGIDVSANADPVLDGNMILDDTTEADVGIELETNPGVAVQVKNNVIHGSGTDRLIDFTPNVFAAGPTITGNQFPDGPASGFGLRGSLTGMATLAPIQGQGTFKLTSTLSVEGGATLNVAAGITVAGRNNSIQVQNGGTLNATGTSAAQRDVQLLDTYVQFNPGSGGQLKNCTITNPSLSYGVYIADASPTVMSCTISSASYGIRVGGSSQADPAVPQIASNAITAGNIAIDISGTAQPFIQDNTLTLNAIAVQIGAGNSIPTVTGNTFDRNISSLAFTREDALFSSLPSTFDDNTFIGRADQNLIDLDFNTITQSGTIQATKVPYRTSGLTIQSGATVTLEPGVVFDHTSFASLVVNGELVAVGTPDRPIIFTSQSPKSGTRWRGLQLHDQSPSSSTALDSCIVEFAGAQQAALQLDNSFAAIRNCTVIANDGDGIEITNGSQPQVTDTTVADNGGDGVTISSGGIPHFSGGTIFHNDGFGMRSEDCPVVRNIISAEHVYWGEDSGPLDANNDTAMVGGLFNPTGHGDAVTDCIDYDPWTQLGPSMEGTLTAKSGSGQSGAPGSVLAQPLCVEIKSTLGSALPNIAVTFSVAEGNGDIETPQPVSTGANGQACASVRLGLTPGANRVAATARDVDSPLATFDAQAGGAASNLFVLTVERPRVHPSRFGLGDMDGDGQLTIVDTALMETALSSIPAADAADVGRGDVNGDGTFDQGDERVMLAYLLHHAGTRLDRDSRRRTPVRAYVRRPVSVLAVGDVLRVPVYLRHLREHVVGYGLEARYDADALDLLAVDAGSTPGFDDAPIISRSAVAPGRARFAAVNRGLVTTHRTVHVATLVFRARASGKTAIAVSPATRMPVVTLPGFETRPVLGRRTATVLVR